MAGSQQDEPPGQGIVRRRHSSQEEDEAPVERPGDARSGVRSGQADFRRPASDSQHTMALASSTIDRRAHASRSTVDGSAPRVRFSTDVERVAASARRGSNSPGLGIDTAQLRHGSATLAGESLSPRSGIVPHKTSVSPDTPLSPRTRTRGYSLRRSLFTRSVHGQVGNNGSIIEMEPASSSRQDPSQTSTNHGRTKKDITNVTISEATEEESSPFEAKKAIAASTLQHYEIWAKRKAATNRITCRFKDLSRFVHKAILKIQEIPPSKDGRHIILDITRKKPLTDERTGKHYIENTIRSSRYTLWNFLPRQLFAQFSKLANFYFLCVSILQMIPTLSTTGTYTTIVPLIFFVSISMAKEGYDDLRRYRLDKSENNSETSILHTLESNSAPPEVQDGISLPPIAEPESWTKIKWNQLQVGHVVKLERDEAAPADLVILHSDGPNGVAYIETMALDGETNLKGKQASPALAESCGTLDKLGRCGAHVVVEDPNLDLYNFEGRVTVAGETRPLTNSEIILRGSILRNTQQAIGLVIYTGEECKIRMNATKNPRIKAPALQSTVNEVVIVTVIFVLILAIFNTIAYQIWSESAEEAAWYLTNAGVAFFPILASFIIMFNTMIPLSLYVSLEIVKLAQMFLMNDVDMYDAASDTPMEARTSTINEELGQVSYVFSDKTGTLTDNSMLFRKMTVAGTACIHAIDPQNEAANLGARHVSQSTKRSKGKKPANRKCSTEGQRRSGVFRKGSQRSPQAIEDPDLGAYSPQLQPPSAGLSKAKPELRTRELLSFIQQRPNTILARKAKFFLLTIALCHTCLPEVQENGDLDFQAASPDELALVRAAKELGFMMVDRGAGDITLKTLPGGPGTEPVFETYEVLDVIEFTSKRKRMSIIVRLPNRRICIFSKGADSTIMRLLKQSDLAVEKAVEVERRVNLRKSMEAQQVIRRNSEHASRKNSMNRPSMNIGRSSLGGIGRSSSISHHFQPTRDEVDHWLQEREHDVEVESVNDGSLYYSPRASAQYGTRHSLALSEGRNSLQQENGDGPIDDSSVADDAVIFERIFQHINDFATEGLRTLLYGYRFLDEEDYLVWKKIYNDAATSLVERQAMIDRAADIIETDLELAGATAIEDRLQKGVPEAIEKLRRANIKMWMLTGDKRETAINIGHSCRLIKDYSTVTVLDSELGDVGQRAATAISDSRSGRVAHSVVVIDGHTLSIVEENELLKSLFFDLAVLVDSVICCRASPSQKASLVHTIRTKVKRSVTLAIGDGANDIAMIQEAHVGIGITGKEGLQAARTSDYSIAQFRFLLKLLLVHGRWNYIRTCKYTVGTFWKEMALYQRWAGYTGISLYESWSLSMFNTLFTSLPVIFLGVFEKDLAASTLLAVPELYTKGQKARGFNFPIYLGWIFMAASEAMMVFFLMLGLYGQALFTEDNGLYAMGALTFSACVIVIWAKLQSIEMHNKSVISAISFVLCVGGWFLWNILLSALYANNTVYNVKQGFLDRFGRNPLWWLVLILVVSACIVFELGVTALRAAYWPTDVDVFQELEKDTSIRERFEKAAAAELEQGWSGCCSQPPAGEQNDRSHRSGEIQELLDRPRVMEEGQSSGHSHRRRTSDKISSTGEVERLRGGEGGPAARRSVDSQGMLTERFGSIRPGW
ncbi:MAG: hypothetical protein M1835_002165 [Candelina submexicana]|nr:MAG: hypothetical protein M1835_002165 [Candelina submexicana]